MTEQEHATNSQEEETGQVQEATEGEQDGEEQERDSESGEETAGGTSPESVEELPKWAQDQIKNLRQENAQRRTKLKEIEDKDKTEQERLTEERDALKVENEQFQKERLANNFKAQINLPSPGLALGAARELGVEIELDEAGKVQNLENIRRRLKKEYPREFGDGDADGASGGGGRTKDTNDMNSMLRAAAGRG